MTLRKNSQMNWALTDQVLVSGANFITGIILARFLGLESFGVFTLAWMVILFFNSLQLASVVQPMMSLAPKYEKEERRAFYGSMFFIQLMWIGLYIFVLFATLFIKDHVQFLNLVSDYFLPIFFVLLTSQLQDFLRRYLFSIGNSQLSFICDSISYLGRIILFVACYYLEYLSIVNVFFCITVANTLSFIVLLKSNESITLKHNKHIYFIRENYFFSKWLLGAALMQWTTGNYFIVVAGVVLGPIVVGAVKACQNIIGFTHILFQALENFVPGMATLSLRVGKKAFISFLIKLTVMGGIVTGALISSVSYFSKELLDLLYGAEYSSYYYLLYWFGILYMLIYLSMSIRIGLRTLEKNRSIFFGYLIATLFSLFSAKPLIDSFGASGVIIGNIFSQCILLLIIFYAFVSHLKECRVKLK